MKPPLHWYDYPALTTLNEKNFFTLFLWKNPGTAKEIEKERMKSPKQKIYISFFLFCWQVFGSENQMMSEEKSKCRETNKKAQKEQREPPLRTH